MSLLYMSAKTNDTTDWILQDFRNLPVILPLRSTRAIAKLQEVGDTASKQAVARSNRVARSLVQNLKPPEKVTKVTIIDQKVTKYLTPAQVAETEGISRKTVNQWITQGKLKAHRILKGSREVWAIPEGYKTAREAYPYSQFYSDWSKAQASGYLSGRPIGPKGVYANQYGLNKFFGLLGSPGSVDIIDPESLRESLSCIPVDRERRNCHYSMRDQVYKGVMSAYKFLQLKGLRDRHGLDDFKPLKPKRIYPPRKTVLPEAQLVRLIQINEATTKGRRKFDITLTRMLLYLMGCAGLRREEVCDLGLEEVRLREGVIRVIDGKGNKDRDVGILPVLETVLADWVASHRPKTSALTFLVTQDGSPCTKTVINNRISRLAGLAGMEITPHGLRRSYATMMAERGMPGVYLQESLGHSSYRTTEGYILTDKRKMIDWLRTGGIKSNPQG